MMDTKELYLYLPTEVEQSLNDNKISIKQYLLEKGIDVDSEEKYVSDGNEITSKGLVTVLLASAVSFSTIIIVISKLVEKINEKPKEVWIEHYDESGNLVKEVKLLESEIKKSNKLEIDFNLPGNIRLKFKNEEKREKILNTKEI
jgi:hypothetical protein